jgi:hypothetical protein
MLLGPWWTLRAGAVPYWSVFPVQSSLAQVHHYLDTTQPYEHIQLALSCHGADSAGLTTNPCGLTLRERYAERFLRS